MDKEQTKAAAAELMKKLATGADKNAILDLMQADVYTAIREQHGNNFDNLTEHEIAMIKSVFMLNLNEGK